MSNKFEPGDSVLLWCAQNPKKAAIHTLLFVFVEVPFASGLLGMNGLPDGINFAPSRAIQAVGRFARGGFTSAQTEAGKGLQEMGFDELKNARENDE